MCGIMGSMTGYAGKLNRDTFEKVAIDTATRGPQAWGVAWIERRGAGGASSEVIRHYKQPGDIRRDLKLAWELVQNAESFILHTRWATHGRTDESNSNLNNHPHAVDGGWLVHNGVVKNYRELREGMHLVSRCDTEVICRLTEDATGRLPDRVQAAIDATYGNLAIAALWKRPTCLVIARRGNPLAVGRMDDGLWFSSTGVGFNSETVRRDTLIEYRYKAGLPMVYRKRPLLEGRNTVAAAGCSYDPSGRVIHQGNDGTRAERIDAYKNLKKARKQHQPGPMRQRLERTLAEARGYIPDSEVNTSGMTQRQFEAFDRSNYFGIGVEEESQYNTESEE